MTNGQGVRDISLQSIPVMTDGEPHEGRLVLADGKLVAVFAQVTAEETAGGRGRPGGWFLEAGFGPCGSLMTVQPPVFEDLEQAVGWVRVRLGTGLSAP